MAVCDDYRSDLLISDEENPMLCIDGREHQILKIYKKCCEIITTSSFDEKDISKRYAGALKKGISLESVLAEGSLVRSFAKELLPKNRLLRKGITIASSAVIDTVLEHYSQSNTEVLAEPGTKTIDYAECEDIQFLKLDMKKDADIGAIKFVLSNSKEVIFFYSDNDESVMRACSMINSFVNDTKRTY